MRFIHQLALDALLADSVEAKSATIAATLSMLESADYGVTSIEEPALRIAQPGQPATLVMVHPHNLKRRKLSTAEGRACFLHAIAHIEFNAINLALDAVYRFRGLPVCYYRDWLRVAAEESRHHHLLVRRLQQLDSDYGAYPVHNGLWDIARRTDHHFLSRMALVPCVFEARGLDVTPPMIVKLRAVGDADSADILQHILDEEVAHVSVGIKWYRYACGLDAVNPIERFMDLMQEYLPNRRQGPFNTSKRQAAGFSAEWMDRLQQLNSRA